MKYRVKISHRLQESIVVDVEAEGPEAVESMQRPLYAEACALKAWRLDWGAAAVLESIEILGDSSAYDVPPNAVFKITGERSTGRDIELVEEAETWSEDDRMTKTVIERALMTVPWCCLDDPEDRKRVVEALIRALR